MGGPGVSVGTGVLGFCGPIHVKPDLSKIYENPNGWHKFANMVMLDIPYGVGYSRRKSRFSFTGYKKTHKILPNVKNWAPNYFRLLKKWLKQHPNFSENEIFIAGDSSAGETHPTYFSNIVKKNPNDTQFTIGLKKRFKGIILEGPYLSANKLPESFCLSSQIFHSLKEKTRENYQKKMIKWAKAHPSQYAMKG